MSDLQLEISNSEEKQTTLIAKPHDLGPNKLKDFVGAHILEAVPDSSLLNSAGPDSNNFGGLLGRGVGTGVGVRGLSTSGHGVWGQGHNGVVGDGAGRDGVGVLGRHSEAGVGVLGQGAPGVVGVCRAQPSPRQGESLEALAGVRGESSHGTGVYGSGLYGGEFKGSIAQIRLMPGTGVGHPATGAHVMGELYLDSAASLFVCIAAGFPGKWVKVVTA
jgi:hypothetical protein